MRRGRQNVSVVPFCSNTRRQQTGMVMSKPLGVRALSNMFSLICTVLCMGQVMAPTWYQVEVDTRRAAWPVMLFDVKSQRRR